MSKIALVTGCTGQDGTFLTKLLLEKGYIVIGLVRRISTEPPRRVRGKFDFSDAIASGQLIYEEGDLLSRSSLDRIIRKWGPEEVYNLAAQSHVGISFGQPEFTIETDFMGVVNLVESLCALSSGWKMYQASTSEMYGNREIGTLLDENAHLDPTSPYAIAKMAAHQYCKMKRGQGKFIACGILFNHESEIRGGDFVTQKIVQGAINWQKTAEPILLGNLNSVRDWGYAGDYVEGMWRMLQQEEPDSYVLATGQVHSIKEFAEATFSALGYSIDWLKKDSGDYVEGYVDGALAVGVDPQFYRPNEVGYLYGDATKAKEVLGWEPKHSFSDLVRIMVEAAK